MTLHPRPALGPAYLCKVAGPVPAAGVSETPDSPEPAYCRLSAGCCASDSRKLTQISLLLVVSDDRRHRPTTILVDRPKSACGWPAVGGPHHAASACDAARFVFKKGGKKKLKKEENGGGKGKIKIKKLKEK